MKEISDFISSVGFPIVVCLIMIYQKEKISGSYIDIVNSLKELVADNTKSINLLISRAKENDEKIMMYWKQQTGDKQQTEVKQQTGVKLDENKQETSETLPDNK